MTSLSSDTDAGPGPPRPPSTTPGSGPRLWRAAAVGALAGLTSGLFGVGGGILIVPGLVIVGRYGQRMAHGTSLTAIVPIAVAGMAGYAVGGEVDFAVAAFVAVGALIGVPLGVALLVRVPQRSLRVGFSALLAGTAVRMVLETGAGVGREAIDAIGAVGYVAIGLTAGLLAGLMGVGGGVLIVPLLTIVFGFPLVLAKGTSLAVIVPTAVVGTIRNLGQDTTDVRAGLLVGIGGVVTAALASQVSLGLDPRVSAWLFAGLLVVVAIRMVRRAGQDPAGPRR